MATLFTEEDAAKYVLQCPHEDTSYPDPPEMHHPDGSARFAYVTLVMLGDAYISAAIVLAQSLIRAESQADRVVLVTPDVSEGGRQILSLYFTHVIPVEYLRVAHWRGRHPRKDYLNLVFTKFHVFDLVQYEKILLIDADALVLKHPDHLFTLPTPAGCYIEDKKLIINYDSEGNYILPEGGTFPWYREYCDCCGHGRRIPKKITDRIQHNRKNVGVAGGLMLLAPQKGELNKILEDVKHGNANHMMQRWMEQIEGEIEREERSRELPRAVMARSAWLVHKFFIWPEQQYLTYRYSGEWHGINPRFFGLQGYPHHSVLFGLQYGGDKPFMLHSKFDLETRKQYPDFVLWHQLFNMILHKYPNLVQSRSLQEAVEMNRAFTASSNLPQDSERIRQIKKWYRLADHQFDPRALYLYNLPNEPIQEVELSFSLREGEWKRPIELLAHSFSRSENRYWPDLWQRVKDLPDEQGWRKLEEIDQSMILLNYLRGRPDMRVGLSWGPAKEQEEIYAHLQTNGRVFHRQKYQLSRRGISSLLYHFYVNLPYRPRYQYIQYLLNRYPIKNWTQPLYLYLFDNLDRQPIDGLGAEMIEQIRETYPQSFFEFTGSQVLSFEVASRVIHPPTRELLTQVQEISSLQNPEVERQHSQLEYLRRLCNQRLHKYHPYYTETMLLDQDATWIPYGFLKEPKLEITVLDQGWQLPDPVTREIKGKKRLYESSSPFLHFKLHGSPDWFRFQGKMQMRLQNRLGIETLHEMVQNPNNFLYCWGFHLSLPRFEINRKLIQLRPQDYGDLVMMTLKHREVMEDEVTLDQQNKLKIQPNPYHQLYRRPGDWNTQVYDTLHHRYFSSELTYITPQVLDEIKPTLEKYAQESMVDPLDLDLKKMIQLTSDTWESSSEDPPSE